MNAGKITAEIIITLPTGEVICRQIHKLLAVKKGYCPKLAEIEAKKEFKTFIKSNVKVEVIL